MIGKDSLKSLGAKIRKARLEKGYSQEELASKANITFQYVSDVERGKRNIAALNLIKIAIALKVQVGELFPSIEKF